MPRTVRVSNASKNTVIAERVEMATSFFARLRGLLGRQSLSDGQGMLLRPTDSIHTFFMAFPIDVIFLDRADRVVRIITNMRPNRISPLVRHGRTVIELPSGALASSETAVGDQLRLE
jgi:hypothetical protein